MDSKLSGSCLCGEVNFKFEGRLEKFFLCHCKHCQKDTGSAFAANVFSTHGSLTWIKGRERIKIYHLLGSRHVKSFCSNCGSALPYVDKQNGLTLIPAGSLEGELNLSPTAHIFSASRANWEGGLADLLAYEKLPTS